MGSHEDGVRSCHPTQPPTSHGGAFVPRPIPRHPGRERRLSAGTIEIRGAEPGPNGLVAEAGDWPWSSYSSMVGTTSNSGPAGNQSGP